jgi:hypothetical protein
MEEEVKCSLLVKCTGTFIGDPNTELFIIPTANPISVAIPCFSVMPKAAKYRNVIRMAPIGGSLLMEKRER